MQKFTLLILLLLLSAGARAADQTEAITLKTLPNGTVVATIKFPKGSRRQSRMRVHADKVFRASNRVTAIGNVVITQTYRGRTINTIRVNRASITL